MDLLSLGIGLYIFGAIMTLFALFLPIYCIIKLLRGNYDGNEKILWVIIIIFMPILGSVIFLLMGKSKH